MSHGPHLGLGSLCPVPTREAMTVGFALITCFCVLLLMRVFGENFWISVRLFLDATCATASRPAPGPLWEDLDIGVSPAPQTASKEPPSPSHPQLQHPTARSPSSASPALAARVSHVLGPPWGRGAPGRTPHSPPRPCGSHN